MPPTSLPLPPQQSRINLSDLKSQIVKKLGPDRAQRYFDHLNRLLSQKLGKHEFDKLCTSILGRENVVLHNQLIRAVLRNAFHAKIPPPVTHDKRLSHLSNGETLPFSPCRSRSNKDRPSSVPPSEIVARRDGDLSSIVLKRPAQYHQSGSAERLQKRQRTDKLSLHDQFSLHDKSLVDVAAVDDQEDVGRKDDFECIRGRPLLAPLGIPFCAASVGGARRSLPLNISGSTVGSVTSYNCGELCNSEDLRTRMEKIAQGHGLGGVTIDCANLLNYGLDAYLKQLISSSVDLLRARTGQELLKQPMFKIQSHGKPINGVWQGSHMYIQNNVGPFEVVHKQENHSPISLQDFKVAMALNPCQLGEDWPLLLEKICLHSFEE
ncbi:Transcriptional coactivator Hfi1/Transcriptional adapter 1 protein [Dioscorea alata]|uniref:Transcriptional coactivator Hfi1/Transcriptional adapter 1 protein n=1 Tax=Dioscorea alata TaxID=55571 RepID=A0ACB7WJB8_DIOAL|nr:Transcriptional coactivator Hfi1/Transcriptional adapter 1 protein [Dioscorea alata]